MGCCLEGTAVWEVTLTIMDYSEWREWSGFGPQSGVTGSTERSWLGTWG